MIELAKLRTLVLVLKRFRDLSVQDPKKAAQMGDALLYVGFQSKVNSCYLDELEDAKEKKAISKVLLTNDALAGW
jgi:hypothetical protein